MFYKVKSRIAGFGKLLLLSAAAVGLGAISASQAQAATTASAYITLRCTATVAIELFSGGSLPTSATFYDFGEVGAAGVYVSANPVGVRNSGVGSIANWTLDITEITQDGGASAWVIGNTPGLNRMTLHAKFSTNTLTSGDFDVALDTVSTTAQGAKAYRLDVVNGSHFYDQIASYVESSFSPNASKVLPASYSATKSERHMWLKLQTPTAFENANALTAITLRVSAY
jgi:hypothetical protein